MKKLFYLWGLLDLKNTNDRKETYFYRRSDEVAEKNLTMIKSLSIVFCIISIVVILMSLTFFDAMTLALIYTGILAIEVIAFIIANYFIKKEKKTTVSNVLAACYLLHLLIIGGIIGTKYSPDESAVVYVVVLAISQILFIFPPILTTGIAGISVICTLIMSYEIKNNYFFKSDVINILGVYVLSILLGWYITKIRIEESDARNEAEDLNLELKDMSMRDQLTTLLNHRSFQDTYYNLYNEMKNSEEPIGIIMMDIDKFKFYNDNYGHLEGDKCLKQIGETFHKLQNENRKVFRFGGEEFTVLLTKDECNHIDEIAERFQQEVEKLGILHAYSPASDVVTVSAGYYLGYPSDEDMPMQLVDKADQALYTSKEKGGNTVTKAIG